MTDILFDAEKREIVIENGDFKLTDNPSVQNGARIRDCKCVSLRFPTFGIGLPSLMNTDATRINFEMERWVKQVRDDGATKASFTINMVGGVANITNNVSYV